MNTRQCAHCDLPAEHVVRGSHFCTKHRRISQMRAYARSCRKAVPTRAELEALDWTHCGDCGVQMNPLAKDGYATVVTLQHYRDGSFGLVCQSCNARHASMAGDSYREMPKDHKRCPKCEQIKPSSDFYHDKYRGGDLKRTSRCKSCMSDLHAEWRERNREHDRAYQRAYRAKRKAEGNPVKRKNATSSAGRAE